MYLWSFLFAGFVCFIGQLIYEKTKLSPGHITSFLVIIGAILSVFGLYEPLIKYIGGGANVLITNFGHLLVKGGIEGANEQGFFGIFLNIFKYCSMTLGFTIFVSTIASFIVRPRDK